MNRTGTLVRDNAIAILPSYGRDGGEDHDDITRRVVEAGWKVLMQQDPRHGSGVE